MSSAKSIILMTKNIFLIKVFVIAPLKGKLSGATTLSITIVGKMTLGLTAKNDKLISTNTHQ